MAETIIIQGIGILGVICFIFSFQIKSNRALFTAQMAGIGLLGIQFFLLGGVTGALNSMIIIIRNTMLCKIEDFRWIQWKGWIVIIGIVAAVILYFTWNGIISIFAFTALMGGTIGYWTNNAKYIRLCYMLSVAPSWILYSSFTGSIGGVLNEVIMLISIFISIYRYGWKNLGSEDFGK